MKLDELESLIDAYESDDLPQPATVHVPVGDEMDELLDDIKKQMRFVDVGGGLYGYDIQPDPEIDSAQILPTDIGDFTADQMLLTDPPVGVIQQLLDADVTESHDPLRDTVSRAVTARVFLKPFCRWQRFDDDMVARYGHPATTASLAVVDDRDDEFTRLNFDAATKTKFGHEHALQPEAVEAGIDHYDTERLVMNLACEVNRAVKQVHSRPVRVRRERRFRFPAPALDFTHTETLRFGHRHTTYEGLLVVPPNRRVEKIELDRGRC